MMVEAPIICPLEWRVYIWEWNPCGKMMVVKEKNKDTRMIGLKLAHLLFPDNGTRKLVGIY
jgi:hypothetical protein